MMDAGLVPPVLRVRRKRGADPAEALVLACKRLRSGASEEEAAAPGPGPVEENVFKLAATVSSQDEPVQKYIREAVTRDKATRALTPSLESHQRIRKDLLNAKQMTRQDDRYRLVSKHRAPCAQGKEALPAVDPAIRTERNKLDSDGTKQRTQRGNTTGVNSSSAEEFQLFDIIHEDAAEKETLPIPDTCSQKSDPDVILCNSVKMIRERLAISKDGKGAEHREKNDDYVYDIYYMETSTPGWIESILSVQPYSQEWELVADDHQAEEIEDDDEDENSENHWRNEYPEEEEGEESSDGESTRGSDEEYGSFSDEESSVIRPRKWNKYPYDVLKEFEYDSSQDLDSD